jgi:hypothetical protein
VAAIAVQVRDEDVLWMELSAGGCSSTLRRAYSRVGLEGHTVVVWTGVSGSVEGMRGVEPTVVDDRVGDADVVGAVDVPAVRVRRRVLRVRVRVDVDVVVRHVRAVVHKVELRGESAT